MKSHREREIAASIPKNSRAAQKHITAVVLAKEGMAKEKPLHVSEGILNLDDVYLIFTTSRRP